MKTKIKIILILNIILNLIIFNSAFAYKNAGTDEFGGLLLEYESDAPKIESCSLSSDFTSDDSVEAYVRLQERETINKVSISAWSGGLFKSYLTTKEATFDEQRGVYVASFRFDEIVNTTTNEIDQLDNAVYYFDAVIYDQNGSMSYASLDDVQYSKTGFLTNVLEKDNEEFLKITPVEDGFVKLAGISDEWIEVKKNSENLIRLDNTVGERTVVVSYMKYADVTEINENSGEGGTGSSQTVTLRGTGDEETQEREAGVSTYKNDDTFTFIVSNHSGKADWVSYEDTPNIFESTIQGKKGTSAIATIRIKTNTPGIVSFDYNASCEPEFDYLEFSVEGANYLDAVEINELDEGEIKDGKTTAYGEGSWCRYAQSLDVPYSGYITIYLKYYKDKNINMYEDKAMIRDLTYTPLLPSNGKVVINSGDNFTNDTLLNLQLEVEGGTFVHLSEDPKRPLLFSQEWQELEPTKTYRLLNTKDGLKTVYAWFKNDSGQISQMSASDTIKLDRVPPTNDAPTATSTPTTITINNMQTDANELMEVYYGYRIKDSGADYTWTPNIRINDIVDTSSYTFEGLSSCMEYEVVTKVTDGASELVESNPTTIKTKVPSDNIVITKNPSERTTSDVTVTIRWNDTNYTHKYSLDGEEWITSEVSEQAILCTENKTIFYMMSDENYDTGSLEYVVDNIDREGPKVETMEVIYPTSGKYGIDDVITIKLTYNEEIDIISRPVLNIMFEDGIAIPVEAIRWDNHSISYEYTVVASDSGYLRAHSLQGGLVKDTLSNVGTNELPELTGEEIYIENQAYIEAEDKYFATIASALKYIGSNQATIKVIADSELREPISVKSNQNVILDLNGKTISICSDERIATVIENEGTLKIIDSSSSKTGKIVANSIINSAYAIQNDPTGNLIIVEGTIEANSTSNSVALESYGIYNKATGSVTLGQDDGTMNLDQVTVTANSLSGVGIYFVSSGGIFSFYDGTVKGTKNALYLKDGFDEYNVPNDCSEFMRDIFIDSVRYEEAYLSNVVKVSLTMNGQTTYYKSILDAIEKIPGDGRPAKITMLEDEEVSNIIKIYDGANVEIELDGHTISRHVASNGDLYTILTNGTLTVVDSSEGGTGRVETVTTTNNRAYGIYVHNKGHLNIDGGTYYARNTAGTKEAYGIYLGGTTSTMNARGNFLVYRDSTYLPTARVLVDFGVYVGQREEEVDGKTYKVNFPCDEYRVSMTYGGNTYYYDSLQKAAAEAPTNGTEAIITMLSPEVLTEAVSITRSINVTIDLNDLILDASKSTYAFSIDNANSRVIITNGKITPGKSYAINMNNCQTLTLTDLYIGTEYLYGSGSGVYAYKGTLNCNNLTIDINNTGSTIYGIRLYYYSTVNINGGSIKVHTNSGSAYGIYAYGNSNSTMVHLTLDNDVFVEGKGINNKSSCYGLYISNNYCTVNYNSGLIRGSTAGIYRTSAVMINNSGTSINGRLNVPERKEVGYREVDNLIENYLTDEEAVAKLEYRGNTTYYSSLADAFYEVQSTYPAVITLLRDENVGSCIYNEVGENIVLDLNGHKIFTYTNRMFYIQGTIEIYDSSENHTGKIYSYMPLTEENGYGGSGTNLIYVYDSSHSNKANLNIHDTSIIVETAETYGNSITPIYSYGGNIVVDNCEIYSKTNSGSIYGIQIYKYGSLRVSNSTISITGERTPMSLYGIYNSSEKDVVVNNSNIFVNGLSNSSAQAGSVDYLLTYGIYNSSTGNIYLDNVNIKKPDCGIYQVSSSLEYKSGTLEAKFVGINNTEKPEVTLGEIEDEVDKDKIIISTEGYPLYFRNAGFEFNMYDGSLITSYKSVGNRPYITNGTMNFDIGGTGISESNKWKINIPEESSLVYDLEGDYYYSYLSTEKNYEVKYTQNNNEVTRYFASITTIPRSIPASTPVTIKLLKDVTETSSAYFDIYYQDITIDLNGKHLTFEYNVADGGSYYGIYKTYNVKMRLFDRSDETGILEITSNKGLVYGIYASCYNDYDYLEFGINDDNVDNHMFLIKSSYSALYAYRSGSVYRGGYYDGMFIGRIGIGGDLIPNYVSLPEGYSYQQKSENSTVRTYLAKSAEIDFIPYTDKWTNQDLEILVRFPNSSSSYTYQLKYGISGDWITYPLSQNAVKTIASENDTLFARCIRLSNAGVITNTYNEGQYEITNIDKVKPQIETVSITNNLGSHQVVSASGASDDLSGIKAYKVTMDIEGVEEDVDWIPLDGNSFEAEVFKNGTYGVFVKDKAGNVSEVREVIATNIDSDDLIINKIEVVSPEPGTYSAGEGITFKVEFNKEINVIEVPQMIVKFSSSNEKEAIYVSHDSNSITYSYTIQEGDKGKLELVSYSGGSVQDQAEREYVNNDVELINSGIYVNTVAYRVEADKYYESIAKAIEDCLEDTNTNTIKLIANDTYYVYGLKINENQDIVLDLNGKVIEMNEIDKPIDIYGTLTIKDSSNNDEKGRIEIYNTESTTGIYNETTGTLILEEGSNINLSGRSTGNAISNHGNLIVNDTNIYCYPNSTGTGVMHYEGSMTINGGIIHGKTFGVDFYYENATYLASFLGGELIGYESGIDLPQSLNIINSDVQVPGYLNLPYGKHIGREEEHPANIKRLIHNFLEDNDRIVKLEYSGDVTYYPALKTAFSAIKDDKEAIVTMLEDEFSLAYNYTGSGKNIILDLNGKTVTSEKAGIRVQNNTEMHIVDNSSSKTGEIYSPNYGLWNDNNSSGKTVTIDGIKITSQYYGVYNSTTGKMILNNSTIDVWDTNANVYAVYNNSSGTVEINNCDITSTEYGTSSNVSGGIFTNSGKLIVDNSRIASIHFGSSSNLNRYIYSYGIQVNYGEAVINNSIINARDCGVYVANSSITTLSNNTIKGKYGIINNSQTATINYNSGESWGEITGILRPSTFFINNDGEATQGCLNIPQNTRLGTRIENDGYIVNYIENMPFTVRLEYKGEFSYYNNIVDAINTVSDSDEAIVTIFENDYPDSIVDIPSNRNITLDLNGFEIYTQTASYRRVNAFSNTSSYEFGFITLNGNLKIIDSSEDKTGLFRNKCSYSSTSSAMITVLGEGTLEIEDAKLHSDNYLIYTRQGNNSQIIINGDSELSSKYTTIYASYGHIILNNGRITSSRSYAIYCSGYTTINNGIVERIIDPDYSSSSYYAIYMSGASSRFTLNDGMIKSDLGYAVYHGTTSAYFGFFGGKLYGINNTHNKSNANIEVPEGMAIKTYKQQIGGTTYTISELIEEGVVKMINKGYVTYYDSLSAAINATPNDGSLTQLIMLTDNQVISDLSISSNKNIILDLNGNRVWRTYSNTNSQTYFIYNYGRFELMDSKGNGVIDIEFNYTGTDSSSYAIFLYHDYYNRPIFKMHSGKINFTTTNCTAYGIYEYSIRPTNGEPSIEIDGGTINVHTKLKDNYMNNINAYGIINLNNNYSYEYGHDVIITGDNTQIIATSEYGDGYGYYNSSYYNCLTVGTNDRRVSSESPFIEGSTSGIYNSGYEQSYFQFYDGAIKGKTGKSVDARIDKREEETVVYVIDNQDGTETTILYRPVVSIEVTPTPIAFNNLSQKQALEVNYLPSDATRVKVGYEVMDTNIAVIRIENDIYYAQPKSTGETDVEFTATDIMNNQVTATIRIIVDLIPPSDDAPTVEAQAYTMTIECNQTDNVGIDPDSIRYSYSSDGGETWSDWTTRSFISGLTPDTDYLVRTKASDYGKNETISKSTLIHTKRPNNSTFEQDPMTVTKENVNVTIIWNNVDLTPQWYKVGDSGDWIFANIEEQTEILVTDNLTPIYTKLVYLDGYDSEIKSLLVENIDRLPPYGTVEINETTPRYDGYVTLTIDGRDDACVVGDEAGSVAYVYFAEQEMDLNELERLPNSSWTKYTGTDGTYDYTFEGVGEVEVLLYLKDKAGNIGGPYRSQKITNDPPICVLFEDGILIGEFQSISAAYSRARSNYMLSESTILICKSHTYTSGITIDTKKNIKLDLNGKTVKANAQRGFYVYGKLEITCNKGTGIFENIYADSSAMALASTSYATAEVKITAGTVKCDYGYGVYNYNGKVIIGTDDIRVHTDAPKIIGENAGIYRNASNSTAKIEFYDGVIESVEGRSFVTTLGYVTTPQYYGVTKEYRNDREYAYLVYDPYPPTYDRLSTTSEQNVNFQTITASNAQDVGTGISAYLLKQDSATPTKTNTGWTYIDTPVNGPVNMQVLANRDGTWYLWLMDGAGNISEAQSIEVTGVKNKVTSLTLPDNTIYVGERQATSYTMTPTDGEPKSISFRVDNEDLVFVNSDTGMLTGLEVGTTKLTLTIVNYDNTIITKTCNVTVLDRLPYIVQEPVDRTVPAGTEVKYNVVAQGNNLNYQWYEERNGIITKLSDNDAYLLRSNIEGQANTVDRKTIVIDTNGATEPTRIKFDYLVSSEAENDTFTVKVKHASGETLAVDSISGEVNATHYEGEFNALPNGTIELELIYSKNGSIDEGLDYGAIRNLEIERYEGSMIDSTFDGGPCEIITNPDTTIYTDKPINYGWVKDVKDGYNVFRSNNKYQSSTSAAVSFDFITNKTGTLSFDYTSRSESGWDYLTIKLIDANGSSYICNAYGYSGAPWNSVSRTVTPTSEGKVRLELVYRKDGSVDSDWDCAAIKNLSFMGSAYVLHASTLESDDIFTFEGNNYKLETVSGANGDTLTIPGILVTESIDGSTYFCDVSNGSGKKTTRHALLNIGEEIPVEEHISKTPPTINVGFKSITLTCNQTGPNITSRYYTISTDRENWLPWQESNVFNDLEEGIVYFAKTKAANDVEEVESFDDFAVMPFFVASLTENGETTFYKSVQEAIDAAKDNDPNTISEVKLLRDSVIGSEIVVPSSKNIVLDLNENELTIATSTGPIVGIRNEGHLVITDKTAANPDESSGKIVVSLSEAANNNAYGVYNTGTLEIYDAQIDVKRPDAYKDYAYGIYQESGSLTLGILDDEININGPRINSSGTGIYREDGEFNFYDGIVTGQKRKSVVENGDVNTPEWYIIYREDRVLNEAAYLREDPRRYGITTVWKIPVDADGAGRGTTITLPIPRNDINNYGVDWGDGTTETYGNATSFPTHTYSNTEETNYTIYVYGTVYSFGYNDLAVPTKTNAYKNYYTFTQYVTNIINWGVTSTHKYGFSNVTHLVGPIPNPMENGFTSVEDFTNLFANCTSLAIALPGDLFTQAVNNTSFEGAFYNCTNIAGAIPENIFSTNVNVVSFKNVFANCGVIGTIPSGLFTHNTSAQNFAGAFKDDTGLTGSIPQDLFKYNIGAQTFEDTFNGCTNLSGEIPAKLFENTSGVTTFKGTFRNCERLTGSIPANLFTNCPNVTTFEHTFNGTSNITGALSALLFANQANVTTFNYTFTGSGITGSIPSGLFANNSNVRTYRYTFANCNNVTGAVSTAWLNGTFGAVPTVFAENNVNDAFECTFISTGVSSITVDSPYVGYRMFYDCNSATNITITNQVTKIGTNGFYATDPYTVENPLITTIDTTNDVALDYDWLNNDHRGPMYVQTGSRAYDFNYQFDSDEYYDRGTIGLQITLDGSANKYTSYNEKDKKIMAELIITDIDGHDIVLSDRWWFSVDTIYTEHESDMLKFTSKDGFTKDAFTVTNQISISMSALQRAERLKEGVNSIKLHLYEDMNGTNVNEIGNYVLPFNIIESPEMATVYSIFATWKEEGSLREKGLLSIDGTSDNTRSLDLRYVGNLYEPYAVIKLEKLNGNRYVEIDNHSLPNSVDFGVGNEVVIDLEASFFNDLSIGEYRFVYSLLDRGLDSADPETGRNTYLAQNITEFNITKASNQSF